MGTRYRHLDLRERCEICSLSAQGFSAGAIAKQLKRSRSTISRELKRNSIASGYRPDTADRIAWARKLRGSILERCSQLKDLVKAQLGMGWTPEQISGRLQLTRSDHRISSESIYRFIYSAAGRKLGWHRYLTQKKAKRGYRAKKGRERAENSDKLPIWLRPTKAHLRSEIGHWEGDCMHFRKQSDILLTLQERRTRVWLMQKLPRRDAETTANTIIDQLENLPSKARKTITFDNGSEFSKHSKLTDEIGMRAFFCEPHSPWQRGSIENGNGRIRRDLPRKADLEKWTDQDIQMLTFIINSTPRKCLGFKTPFEAFAENFGVALEM